MRVRDVNRFFLIIVCIYLAGASVVGVLAPAFLDSSAGSVLTAQGLILCASLICCRMKHLKIRSFMRIRAVKWSVLFSGIACTACIYPFLILVSSLVQLYFRSGTDAVAEELYGGNLLLNLVIYALIPACAEELMNRGLLYHAYRKTCGVRKAMLLSSLLFGLFHMNLDQFAYTFLFGLFLCLITEAGGSLLPAAVCHIALNAITVVSAWMQGNGAAVSAASVAAGGIVLCICGAACIAFFLLLLHVSGRKEVFVQSFSGESIEEKGPVFTSELIIGMGICILYMVIYEMML